MKILLEIKIKFFLNCELKRKLNNFGLTNFLRNYFFPYEKHWLECMVSF